MQIRQSLPYIWRTLLNSQNQAVISSELIYFENKEVKLLEKTDSKKVYSFFNLKNRTTPTCISKWQLLYPEVLTAAWSTIFKRSFIISRETRLQSFQYRILHRTSTCRKKLYEMKLVDTPTCTVCPETDNLQQCL